MHCLCDGLLLDKVNEEKGKKIKSTKSPDAFIAENWVKKNVFCVTNE